MLLKNVCFIHEFIHISEFLVQIICDQNKWFFFSGSLEYIFWGKLLFDVLLNMVGGFLNMSDGWEIKIISKCHPRVPVSGFIYKLIFIFFILKKENY